MYVSALDKYVMQSDATLLSSVFFRGDSANSFLSFLVSASKNSLARISISVELIMRRVLSPGRDCWIGGESETRRWI